MTGADQELARQLLEREAGAGQATAEDLAGAAERVCGKLQARLVRVLGQAGFEAILTRALKLAQGEFPALAAVQLRMDGERCLEGLGDALAGKPAGAVTDALVGLLATFLGLLNSLVGRDLAMRLLSPVWAREVDTGFPRKE